MITQEQVSIFLKEREALQKEYDLHNRSLIEKYGSAQAYRDSLNSFVINRPDDTRLGAVYDFYSLFFTMYDECESFEGFKRVLSLNISEKYQKQYGTFADQWLVFAEDDGRLAAGVNFSYFKVPRDVASAAEIDASMHINYIFVREDLRSLGMASMLLEKCRILAADRLAAETGGDAASMRLMMFCEQNAPELMDRDGYFKDFFDAKIDPCDRMIWWDKRGFKRLNINYKQFPLNLNSTPCTTLTLNISFYPSRNMDSIPGKLILAHMRPYLQILVFKGSNRSNDPYITELEDYLANNEVGTSGSISYYEALKRKFYDFGSDIEPMEKLFKAP